MSNHLQGQALLNNSTLNKGTAFPAERRIFQLEGLLPNAVESPDRQVDRAIRHLVETEVTTATRDAEFMFDKDLAQVERRARAALFAVALPAGGHVMTHATHLLDLFLASHGQA